MAYDESKTNWIEDDEFTPGEMNRVEGNVKALAEEAITISGNKTHTGTNDFQSDVSIDGAIDINDNDITNSGAILGRGAAKRIEPAGTFSGGAVSSYVNESTIWTTWAALIPVIGQKAIVSGGFKVIGIGVDGHIGYIERTSSTRITIHYLDNTSSTYTYYWLDSTDTANWEVAVSW